MLHSKVNAQRSTSNQARKRNEGGTGYLGGQKTGQANRSITQGLFSLRGTGQRFFLNCDRFRSRILDLVGLGRIEFDVFREFRREVGLRVDGVDGTYFYAGDAIGQSTQGGHDDETDDHGNDVAAIVAASFGENSAKKYAK